MPTFQFEAMDQSGQEIKDVIEAPSQDEAQATIRQMGHFVTKIAVKKGRKRRGGEKGRQEEGKNLRHRRRKNQGPDHLHPPALHPARRRPAHPPQPEDSRTAVQAGALKNCLINVCDEIESGSTLSEAMGKSPKAFNRLYVNMIKAGEAGGALEVILKRLAEFQERDQALRRKVKGALVYPVTVVVFAVGILTFIMLKIVPQFIKIFQDFGTELPVMTEVLIAISKWVGTWWFLIPGIPISIWLFIKLLRKFSWGRTGWDMFKLKMPIFGQLVEKDVTARTVRTLGTLVASGVPILEALHITRDTSGNAVFERLFQKVYEAIREGEAIAKPLKENSKLWFHPMALFFWSFFIVGPIGALIYVTRMNKRILDDMVVNMVNVGEETGELDTMLYKVADNFDEEVAVLTESLMSLMEPLLIIVLGVMVGFIVIALFLPLIALIQKLS